MLARLSNLNDNQASIFINTLRRLANDSVQTTDARKVLVIETPGLLYCLLFSILSSKSTNAFYSYHSIGFNAAVGNTNMAAFRRRCFGYIKYKVWRKIYSINMRPLRIIPDHYKKHKSQAQDILHQFKKCENKSYFTVDGLRVGDLVIDSYVRFCPSPYVDYEDPLLLEIFTYLLILKQRFEDAVEKLQPDEVITCYTVYLEYGIPVRLALKYGLTVRSYGNDHAVGQLLTRDWPYHTPNVQRDYARKRKQYENRNRLIQFGRQKLQLRTTGFLDASLNYMQSSAFQASNQVAEKLKDSCIIFAHHFSDSAHIYPNFIYESFYEWLEDTTKQLELLNQNYFIKPHPSQGADEVQVLQRIVAMSRHGAMIDNALSNNIISNSNIKFAITAYGTICHELSFLGIPVLSCSDNPHSSFGFNNQARSKADYARQIKLSVTNKLKKNCDYSREAALFYSVHNYPPDPTERQKMKKIRELRVSLATQNFDIWPSTVAIKDCDVFR